MKYVFRASELADAVIPTPEPYNTEKVMRYTMKEFAMEVKAKPKVTSDAPKNATCRKVNRRNIGPFRRPTMEN